MPRLSNGLNYSPETRSPLVNLNLQGAVRLGLAVPERETSMLIPRDVPRDKKALAKAKNEAMHRFLRDYDDFVEDSKSSRWNY